MTELKPMSTLGITHAEIWKITGSTSEACQDLLVREEPLEIRLGYGEAIKREEFALAVTMRTPGADEELARGFLLSEGIVHQSSDILSIRYCLQAEHPENTIKVELQNGLVFDPEKHQRNFYASSSCGVCGKAALEAIQLQAPKNNLPAPNLTQEILLGLADTLQEGQTTFKHTGGLHAAALFDLKGQLLVLREDIGRHNALDKLIGVCALKQLPLHDKILWLSGRAGFELIQKSVMTGIKAVVSLGAPSSLAVALAQDHGMVLAGFLKKNSFNIYSGKENVILGA